MLTPGACVRTAASAPAPTPSPSAFRSAEGRAVASGHFRVVRYSPATLGSLARTPQAQHRVLDTGRAQGHVSPCVTVTGLHGESAGGPWTAVWVIELSQGQPRDWLPLSGASPDTPHSASPEISQSHAAGAGFFWKPASAPSSAARASRWQQPHVGGRTGHPGDRPGVEPLFSRKR